MRSEHQDASAGQLAERLRRPLEGDEGVGIEHRGPGRAHERRHQLPPTRGAAEARPDYYGVGLGQKLQELKDAGAWDRAEYVMKQGWATLPGDKEPERKVADECAKLLVADAK